MLELRHPSDVEVKLEDQMVGECQQEYQYHYEMWQTVLEANLGSLMEIAHSDQQVQD